jgi:hypothetical protein
LMISCSRASIGICLGHFSGVSPGNPNFKLPQPLSSVQKNPELGTESQLVQAYEHLGIGVMADVSEWAISTVSRAALERTINSFATASRAPFESTLFRGISEGLNGND